LIRWSLRVAVAVACLGNWWHLALQIEHPLLDWLHNPIDVGGWAWSESAAIAAVRAAGWLSLVAGLVTLVRPEPFTAAAALVLQLLFVAACWGTHHGYALQLAWLPGEVKRLFPLATQAARIAAPLGLVLLVLPARARSDFWGRAYWPVLRWGIAITFLAHGLEAWERNPEFVDLMIASGRRLLGWSMSEAVANRALLAIAVADWTAAACCLATRSRKVLLWMAFWGLVTAASRVTAYGWLAGGAATLQRAPHALIPWALYWESRRPSPG
jgi:hypothetical protein